MVLPSKHLSLPVVVPGDAFYGRVVLVDAQTVGIDHDGRRIGINLVGAFVTFGGQLQGAAEHIGTVGSTAGVAADKNKQKNNRKE